jgi:predicted nucleic acid-binding protein
VIPPDANTLLYAVNTSVSQHRPALDLTSDAHLAALAIEHNAKIVSFDRDFARLADVSWEHPA